ncbi:hypothetical protein WN55_01828 [Dufourea novaeangliae]|uniref:Uncharacterized protein n=1 Tax=Dufourea novaeangliae TaxID=178035 RepID=A0A154PG05_DUFNO|nr:hypothetical protein WN55_01828 [Dufourea novaeangliae]
MRIGDPDVFLRRRTPRRRSQRAGNREESQQPRRRVSDWAPHTKEAISVARGSFLGVSSLGRRSTAPQESRWGGCVSKHRIYDKNQELVPCSGPFYRFAVESEADMKKASAVAGGSRDRLGCTGSTACKKEIKMVFKEIVREELGNIKQELLEELRRMIQDEVCESTGGIQRSCSEAIKEKKKENVIIIKPKIQQESEGTKN